MIYMYVLAYAFLEEHVILDVELKELLAVVLRLVLEEADQTTGKHLYRYL